MNEREFDAYLREALRQPGPAHVPDDVRADEISRAVSIVADELLWGDADQADDTADGTADESGRDDAPGDHDLSVWDERRDSAPWDDDAAGDVDGDLDNDDLLASEPLDHDAGHHDVGHDLDFGVHDSSSEHGPLGHGHADGHDAHDHGTHHDET